MKNNQCQHGVKYARQNNLQGTSGGLEGESPSAGTFKFLINKLEKQILDQRALLQIFLDSGTDIDEMNYNEVLEWADNEIEEDYRNNFICEWKDYAFLRGKLEGFSMALKEINKKIEAKIIYINELTYDLGNTKDLEELSQEILNAL